MPLREAFTLAAHRHFEQIAQRRVAQATPKPRPQPLLPTQPALARLSPQPDRLVSVRAARVPLIEAARPLLMALAHMPTQRDAAQVDALHSHLVYEVTAFQSACADALVRHEYIAGASYALCTALDEAAGLSAWAVDRSSGLDVWARRQLAVQFHGDGRGGRNVFSVVANLLKHPSQHIDLLELLLIVIALGFEGMYRTASNGKRALDEIRHAVLQAVRSCRAEATPVAHWTLIENLLWGRMPPGDMTLDEKGLFL